MCYYFPGGELRLPGIPAARFRGLPFSKVLTLHMDVPEAWLVEPVRAAHDLDNLRLSDLGSDDTLNAEFELEAILLTGRCLDIAARSREQVFYPPPSPLPLPSMLLTPLSNAGPVLC